jgi:hypothetical protein
MSYQNGSATSATDLLQQLVTWLVSLGWTQDRSAIEGFGWTASLHHNANYVHLRAVMNESGVPWHANSGGTHYGLHMYLGTAFNSGQPFNNQIAGAPIGSTTFPIGVGMQLSVGPFSNYYFFADSTADNIVVVVEKTPGLYLHIGWGLSIQKAGSFTGGPYFFGSSSGYYTSVALGANIPGYTITSDCPFVSLDGSGSGGPGFVRADVDSWVGKWIGIFNATSGADQGFTGKEGNSSVCGRANTSMKTNFPVYATDFFSNIQFQSEQTSQQDGRANLLPIIVWVLRDGTTTGFSMLGTIPNIFSTNAVGNGFSNAQEYVLGATTYKLFPNFAVVKQ